VCHAVPRRRHASIENEEGSTWAEVANHVTSPIGNGGDVRIFTQNGTHLIADVTGWYVGGV
jgi:hypothetical protein